MIITALIIKVFFGVGRKQQGKPKIKNTISFKRLNLVYSLGLICAAGLHANFMENQSKDSYMAHITVTLVINIMMLSLILTDNEAREFFTKKIRNWMDENDLPKLQNLFKRRNKVWPVVDENVENGRNIA